MSARDDEPLAERVARLERLVEELRAELGARPAAPPVSAARQRMEDDAGDEVLAYVPPVRAARLDDGLPARRRRPEPALRLPAGIWDSQFWLNRLGIGLVLLGVALLFRYSIEQGWLTPAVRVGFGAALGAVLFAAGLRLDERRRFGAVLVGGALADFYIVGFAAFYLYGLIGYTLAFAGMVAITLTAYGLGIRRNAPALAVVGALGGLGTPLILGLTHGTPRGFALYTSLILAWTAGVLFFRGWRSLLWTALSGGWLLLALYARKLPPEPAAASADRWIVQAAVLFAYLSVGLLPLARRVVATRAGDGHEPRWGEWERIHWYALVLLPPALALVVTGIVWHPAAERWGYLVLAASLAYALAAWTLYRVDARLARAGLFAASVLLSMGSVAAFGGDSLLLALAGQALVLHWLAGRGGGRALRWMAHKVYIAAGAWLLYRLVSLPDSSLSQLGADAGVLACGLIASYLVRSRHEVLAYRYFVHVGWMGWLWRELAPLAGGQGLATIAWGAYAVGLLLLAMRSGRPLLEKTAVATLLVVVAKLFLVDLAALEALFRVLLFLGLGSVFLLLSYVLQDWWRGAGRERDRLGPAREGR